MAATALTEIADIPSSGELSMNCEWVYPNTEIECGTLQNSVNSLLSHIRTQHCIGPSIGPLEPLTCHWKLCSFTTAHPTTYTCHLLFHGYHVFLKAKGLEYQSLKALPACKIANNEPFLPIVEEGWKCLWEYDELRLCGSVYCCAKSFYDHVRGHVDTKVESKCRWKGCLFQSPNQWKLTDHVRTHTQERVIACPQCGTLFSNKTKFKDHLDRQATPPESGHVCSICHKAFSTDRLLLQHIRRHVNTQKCPYCEMTCSSPSALTYHLHYKHTEGNPHQCPICLKEYKTHYALADHVKIHRDKHIHCDREGCSYFTNTLRNYRQHLRTEHSNVALSYCCHVCEEQFPQGTKLTSHLKSIHGFSLPPGHSRFRYIKGQDGMRRLQTVRLIDKSISTTSTT